MRWGRAVSVMRFCSASLAACSVAVLVADVSSTSAGVTAAAPPSGYVLASAFGVGGVMTFPTWTDVRDIAVVPDGSALVQLDRRDSGGALSSTGIAKLRANGTLDPAFAPGGSMPGIVEDSAESWGSLTPLADGGFFVGSRRYGPDGAVDTAYGAGGYIAINGSMFANPPTALVELADHRVVMISDAAAFHDCYIFVVDAMGTPGALTATGVLCSEAIPLRMPDGSTLIVVHEISSGYHLLRLNPGGVLDTSYGTGGIVAVDPAIGISPRLLEASPTPDGSILLLPQGYVMTGVIARIDVGGILDPAFGGSGEVAFNGIAQTFTVDDNSAPLVGVGYTFGLHPTMPYHPAMLQLTASGQINQQFNPSGLKPGWLDMTEVGISEPAGGGPQARFGSDQLLVGLDFGVTGTSPRLAALVELTPSAPLATTQPTPPPTTASKPSITAAATATAKAIRLGPIAGH